MNNLQEEFWTGSFGTDCCERNQGLGILATNLNLLAEVLTGITKALKSLLPNVSLNALEINPTAVVALKKLEAGAVEFFQQSNLETLPLRQWRMELIKGVLFHIAPVNLNRAYRNHYDVRDKYLVVAEYHSLQPVEWTYRGCQDFF